MRTRKGSNEQQAFMRTPVRTSQDDGRQVTDGNGMGRVEVNSDIFNLEIGNLIQPSPRGNPEKRIHKMPYMIDSFG